MTTPVPTPVSDFPLAGALDGTEIVPVVKDGITSQSTTQDIADLAGGGALALSGELALVAAAGNNNNAALGSANNSLLVNTAAGAAALTGIAAGDPGQVCVVTNTGANTLDLPPEDLNSTAANRLYGAVTLTLLQNQSRMLVYSPTLTRWRLV